MVEVLLEQPKLPPSRNITSLFIIPLLRHIQSHGNAQYIRNKLRIDDAQSIELYLYPFLSAHTPKVQKKEIITPKEKRLCAQKYLTSDMKNAN